MKKRLLLSFMALLTSSGMWAADGDVFTANTIEGVEMTFMVISETEKTCQVGIGDGDNCSINSAIEGSLTIPSEANGYCVTSIGYYALGGCSGLTAITIPNSVQRSDDRPDGDGRSLRGRLTIYGRFIRNALRAIVRKNWNRGCAKQVHPRFLYGTKVRVMPAVRVAYS